MKQPRTLWTNRESKFKPRNKQAALICIKAKEIHLPPPEPVEYTPRRPSKEEILRDIEVRLEALNKAKLAEMERQEELKRQDREKAKLSKRKRAKQPPKQAWLKRWLAKAEKQKGSLSPSPEAIAAVKKAHTKPSTPKDHV